MKNKSKSKVGIIYFFLILCYFKPAAYVFGNEVSTLWQYLIMIISCGIIAIYFLELYSKRIKWNKWLSIFYIYNIYMWIITSLLSKSIIAMPTAIFYCFQSIGFLTLIDLGLQKNPHKLFKSLISASFIMCGIHILTMFLYYSTGGMNHGVVGYSNRTINGGYYFLSHDNGSFFIIFPILIISWIYYNIQSSVKFKRIVLLFSIIVCAAFLYTWSVTAMIMYLLFLLSLFFIYKKKRKILTFNGKKITLNSLFDIKKIGIFIITLSILFTFCSISLKFSSFIEEYFNKSADLSGRLSIWNSSILEIKKSILIGYGWETDAYTFFKLNMNHTHNFLLQILYTGGIIGLLLFLILVTYGLKNININLKNSITINNIYKIIIIGMALYFLAAIFDYYLYQFWIFIVIEIAYSLPYLSLYKKIQ